MMGWGKTGNKIIAYFNVLSCSLFKGPEENHRTSSRIADFTQNP
jgi:hypothetical protein